MCQVSKNCPLIFGWRKSFVEDADESIANFDACMQVLAASGSSTERHELVIQALRDSREAKRLAAGGGSGTQS